MRLYFIRHAQSRNNQLYHLTGNSKNRNEDPELTDIGKLQAEILADFLASSTGQKKAPNSDFQDTQGIEINSIYTSLMVRAVHTARTVAHKLGLPLTGWIDLHEEGGIYLEDPETGAIQGMPGKSRAYFSRYYPELTIPAEVSEGGWWGRPRESGEEARARAERVLEMLLVRHGESEDHVALVSHGGFYTHFMSALFNLGVEQAYFFALNNTAMTRVDFEDGRIQVTYMNRLDFMPKHLVT